MDGTRLQSLLERGAGITALHVGTPYLGYRPIAAEAPLSTAAQYGPVMAAFDARSGRFQRPSMVAESVWVGVFDASVTAAGDYLVGAAGTFFIATQPALLPPVCILTNRTLSLSRPGAPGQVGANSYGGVAKALQTALLAGWPGSVTDASGAAPGLPGEQRFAAWSVRLPALPVDPQAGDMLGDDLGHSYVVVAAGQTDGFWQLAARQMT